MKFASHTHTFTGDPHTHDQQSHEHGLYWAGNHSHYTKGIGSRSETGEGFGGGIDPNRHYGNNQVATSSSSITINTKVDSVTAVNIETVTGGTNSSEGASSGGTHGKLLGMNYIIKT